MSSELSPKLPLLIPPPPFTWFKKTQSYAKDAKIEKRFLSYQWIHVPSTSSGEFVGLARMSLLHNGNNFAAAGSGVRGPNTQVFGRINSSSLANRSPPSGFASLFTAHRSAALIAATNRRSCNTPLSRLQIYIRLRLMRAG